MFCSVYYFIISLGLPKPNHQDANTSLSSDEEMFQECESGFDLDATPVVPNPASIRAHSSNIDHNVFDKTINFSSITSNSTAALVATTTKDESLFKTIVDQTYESTIDQSSETSGQIQADSIEHSIKIENMSEETNAENSIKSPEKMVGAVEQPANIEIIVTQDGDSITEQIDSSVQSDTKENVPQEIPSVGDFAQSGVGEMQVEEKHVEETLPDRVGNVTQDIETTAEPTVQVNMTEAINDLNNDITLNLDQTIDLSSPLPKENEWTTQDQIEIFSSTSNPEDNKNTTIAMEPAEIASEAAESGVNSAFNAIEGVQQATEPNKNETPLNETIEIVSKAAEVAITETIPVENEPEIESNEMKPFETIPVVETPLSSIPATNQTFEAMDVDMDETIELQQETNELPIEQPLLNQTVEMTEGDPNDEVPKPDLNVTVDVPAEIVEQKSMINEIVPPVDEPTKVSEMKNQPMLNVTQDFIDEPKKPADLNQTVDLSNSKENISSPVQVNGVNDTFVKSESPSVFDQTQNISRDFLSSTRRSTGSNSKTNMSLPNVNLNETIVVDNKLPSINTSYIVSPKDVEMPAQSNGLMKSANQGNYQIPNHDQFKLPAAPSTTSNPFELKQKQQDFEISDDEFQSPGCK